VTLLALAPTFQKLFPLPQLLAPWQAKAPPRLHPPLLQIPPWQRPGARACKGALHIFLSCVVCTRRLYRFIIAKRFVFFRSPWGAARYLYQ
jgi:hypothetical protein